jgi:hypothetical protein
MIHFSLQVVQARLELVFADFVSANTAERANFNHVATKLGLVFRYVNYLIIVQILLE